MHTDYRILGRAFAVVCILFVLGLASGVALNLSGQRDLGQQVFRAALWVCAAAFLVYAFAYWRLCRHFGKSFTVWVALWAVLLPFAFVYSFIAMRSLVNEQSEAGAEVHS